MWVCISKDVNQCQIPTILYREATHANSYCNQPQGPAGGFIDLKDCRKQERAAYGNSCEKEAEVECIPNHLKQKWIDMFIYVGVKQISCRPPTPGELSPTPCKDDLPRVFPESQVQPR